MRNYELIKEIYELCNREPDVGSGEIMNIIERERPELKSHPCLGFGSSDDNNSVDVKEIERHVGLEIGPDGTVNSIIGNNYSGLD